MTSLGFVVRVFAVASYLVSGAIPAVGADLSRYRDFQLGAGLSGILKQSGANSSQVKVIHQRPSLIQEFEWRPQPFGSSAKTEAVQDVTFSFVDGKLFRIVVNYDRYETAGLTSGDIIESLSGDYGATAALPVPAKRDSRDYADQEEVIGVWQDPRHRFTLTRTAYGPSYRLTGVMTQLEAPAQAAIAEAGRLDDLEAPQRAAARVAAELETERIKLEKSRAANKAKFKP
jgi:hypothetical protein